MLGAAVKKLNIGEVQLSTKTTLSHERIVMARYLFSVSLREDSVTFNGSLKARYQWARCCFFDNSKAGILLDYR